MDLLVTANIDATGTIYQERELAMEYVERRTSAARIINAQVRGVVLDMEHDTAGQSKLKSVLVIVPPSIGLSDENEQGLKSLLAASVPEHGPGMA